MPFPALFFFLSLQQFCSAGVLESSWHEMSRTGWILGCNKINMWGGSVSNFCQNTKGCKQINRGRSQILKYLSVICKLLFRNLLAKRHHDINLSHCLLFCVNETQRSRRWCSHVLYISTRRFSNNFRAVVIQMRKYILVISCWCVKDLKWLTSGLHNYRLYHIFTSWNNNWLL